MLTHPEILHPNGQPVLFHTQEAIAFVLWCREQVKRSRAIRGVAE